jgi:hypothetical protein
VLVPLAGEQPPLPFIAAAFAACSHQIDRHTRRYVLATLLAESRRCKAFEPCPGKTGNKMVTTHTPRVTSLWLACQRTKAKTQP